MLRVLRALKGQRMNTIEVFETPFEPTKKGFTHNVSFLASIDFLCHRVDVYEKELLMHIYEGSQIRSLRSLQMLDERLMRGHGGYSQWVKKLSSAGINEPYEQGRNLMKLNFRKGGGDGERNEKNKKDKNKRDV